MRLHLTKPLAFIDLQTTGTSVTSDRIVEVAVQVLNPDGAALTYSRRFNPECDIPEEASKIHGIRDVDVQSEKTFADCAADLAKFIGDADVSGFNVRAFDIPILMESFARAGIDWSVDGRSIVDVQCMFHLMEPRDLPAAQKFYCGTAMTSTRAASENVAACRAILEAQIEKYRGRVMLDPQGVPLGKVENDVPSLHALLGSKCLDIAGRLLRNNAGDVVFNFGKHKGVPVRAVVKLDYSYLRWMLNSSSFSQQTKQLLRAEVSQIRNGS